MLVVHDQQKYATSVAALGGSGHHHARADQLMSIMWAVAARHRQGNGGGASRQGDRRQRQAAAADTEAKITKIEAKATSSSTAIRTRRRPDWALRVRDGHGGRQCGVNPRSECAAGDRLVIDLKTGESRFENPGNTPTGVESVRCSCRRLMPTRSRRTRSLATSNRPAKESPHGGPGADLGDAAPAAASGVASPEDDTAHSGPKPAAQDDKPGRSSRVSPSRRPKYVIDVNRPTLQLGAGVAGKRYHSQVARRTPLVPAAPNSASAGEADTGCARAGCARAKDAAAEGSALGPRPIPPQLAGSPFATS